MRKKEKSKETKQCEEIYEKLLASIPPLDSVKNMVSPNDPIDFNIVDALIIDSQAPVDEYLQVLKEDVEQRANAYKKPYKIGITSQLYTIYFYDEKSIGMDVTDVEAHSFNELNGKLPRKVTYDLVSPFALAEIVKKCYDNEEVRVRLQYVSKIQEVCDACKNYADIMRDQTKWVGYLFPYDENTYFNTVLNNAKISLKQGAQQLLAASKAMKKAGII